MNRHKIIIYSGENRQKDLKLIIYQFLGIQLAICLHHKKLKNEESIIRINGFRDDFHCFM